MSKVPFPRKLQYAMNLANGSREAVDRIKRWHKLNAGNVEHKTTEHTRSEVLPLLKKNPYR